MKPWIKGLAAAVVGGAANAAAAVIAVPEIFDWSDMTKLGKVALAGALIALFAYLKQSPVPPNGN